MKYLLATILLFTLGACGLHQPVESTTTAPAEKTTTEQHSPTQPDLSGMQPDFLYLAAQKATREGNRELALQLLTALVAKQPNAITPHMQLIDLLMESGRIDEAEQHIAHMLSNKALPAEQREQLQLAQYRIYISHDQPQLALEKLNTFLQKHPAHDTARTMQASILAGLGRMDEALASIKLGIKQHESAGLRMLQARLLIKRGDLKRAKASLLRVQHLMPDNDAAVLMLSALAAQMKDHEQAEKLLRDFLANHPQDIRVSHALAKLLVAQARLPEAIIVYRNAAKHAGDSPVVLRPLGMLYFQDKDYEQAVQTFRTLVKLQPDDSNRFYLAASLEAMDKLDEAKSIYTKITHASKMYTQAQIRLAAMDLQENKLSKAKARMLAILHEKPQQLDAHLLLSTIRLNSKEYKQVLDETEPLLRLKKLPPQLLFNRAVAFEHFKNYDQVETTLNRVLEHSPNYTEALNFLGYTYADQGIKLDRAKALILRALHLKPNDGYYLDSLAWVYYKTGDYKQAAETQAKAIKLVADDSVMHEHYGDILWRSGNTQAAQQAWRKALELKSDHPRLIKAKISKGLPPVDH
ncbi:tetratricopeptide repeat protein [Mariprofundus ferrooxydans]|uniref:tetratricopeptide repeat protein n=1 Tax=Mariprofundus ferrooxydans TaxID=314344 RepID=UPI00037B2E90|nr:tetratricopeptide repeat protein [Mariprofundus ferrooxydans]